MSGDGDGDGECEGEGDGGDCDGGGGGDGDGSVTITLFCDVGGERRHELKQRLEGLPRRSLSSCCCRFFLGSADRGRKHHHF